MSGYHFFSAILLLGGIQGILLVVALHRVENSHRSANRMLSAFVLLISLVLISRVVYIDGVEIWRAHPHLFLIPDIPMFLYGPLFYLYIRRLFSMDPLKGWKYFIHFAPAVVHLVILGSYLMESQSVYMERIITGNLIEMPYVVWLSLGHMAFYLFKGYLLFRKHGLLPENTGIFKNGRSFVNAFFSLAGICWVSWFYAALVEQVSTLPSLSLCSYHISWVALSFTSYFLVFFAMTKPEVFKKETIRQKYRGSSLSSDELDLLEQKLINLMDEFRPYLDAGLQQQKLADMMDLPPKDLSRLINERFGQNFFDFINMYRVEEFKRLSQLPDSCKLTILAIAYRAGFNSKTTFNTAFKKIAGMTPSEFIDNP